MNDEQKKEEELLKTLMKHEAELSRIREENRKLQKQCEYIRQSRTWKYGAPIRKISALFYQLKSSLQSFLLGPKAKELLQQNKELEEDKRNLQKELQMTQEQLRAARQRVQALLSESEKLDSDHLRKTVKQAKKDGEIMECLDGLIQQKEVHDDHYNKALEYAGKLMARERAEFKQMVYAKILSGLKIEDIPEFIVRDTEQEETVPLNKAASFRASLSMRSRKRQLRDKLPEWILDHKVDAYAFIDDLHVKRPWVPDATFKFADIPQQKGIVIKPLRGAGSRGVYLVYDSNHIQDVKRSRMLGDWKALQANITEDLACGWVSQDEWIIEELVTGDQGNKSPARDLKFYCFYGKVALILEVDRFPELEYCWWTPNGERISTGKYDGELFKGSGVTQSEIQLASSISLEIPAPFIRIDFLRTDEELVFGEFTPKPGNYDEFDNKTDQWLGDYYLDAEVRLLDDLLNEKPFGHFKKLLSSK